MMYNLIVKYFCIVVLLANGILAKHKKDKVYCYSKDENRPQIWHYAMQTQHKNVSGILYEIGDCEPFRIWTINRHGTRYPGNSKNEIFKYFLPKVQKKIVKTKHMCQEDFDLIKSWTFFDHHSNVDLADPQGWIDLRSLAKSYKTMFPTIFNEPYSPHTYNFAYASSQRTKASFQAFTQGLFESLPFSDIQHKENITLLQPYMFCSQFTSESNSQHVDEVLKFRNSTHVRKLIKFVTKRFGMCETCLPWEIIVGIWYECTFTQAWNINKPIPWCATFGLRESKIMEYVSDLDNYYKASYGYPLSEKIPCVLFKDMLMNMKHDTNKHKVTAYFAHASLLLMIITAFGYARDSLPLTADNFDQDENKQFQTSQLAPYASSFAAVKYKCKKGRGRVLFLLNQQPMALHWCKSGALCTVDEIEKYFRHSSMANCPYGICGKKFVRKNLF